MRHRRWREDLNSYDHLRVRTIITDSMVLTRGYVSIHKLLTLLRYNRFNIAANGGTKTIMDDIQSLEATDFAKRELLYFWAFGDLHYRAFDQWHAIHSRRLAPMFQDVNALWLDQGAPAFCVTPG